MRGLAIFLAAAFGVMSAGHRMVIAKPAEITAQGPQGMLAGTLIEAKDTAPLVLIIPGSGPTDRDGNNPLGVTAAPYRLLAEALEEKGISTIRFDKRGMFGSDKATDNPNDVTISSYVNDINAWIDAAQKREPKRKCLWLLGHSEGGLMALAAAQGNNRVCGIILAAAPGRRLGNVLREQLQANPAYAPILKDARHALDELEAGRKVDVSAMHPALAGLFAPPVQGFLIDLFATDPAALASTLKQPLLIIQGGRDIQVSYADAELLAKAHPSAKLMKIEEMTHMLKAAGDQNIASIIATYQGADTPVDKRVIEAIVAFVGSGQN